MRPLGPHDPRTAGRHRLFAVIGQGAMGRVLLGRAPDGRLVAVKMIHRHLARNAEFRARFRLEVQASQRVTGAYTAAVMDADPDAEDPWLASVFVPGPGLRAAVDRQGPLPLGGLRLLTAGLGSALVEIHRAGMIHRDLKPANVLLAEDGPRVIDFGIARALEAEVQLTTTGTLVGSPAYMSPEQAVGHELDTASDVFSVGAMLFMAATGDSPFLGASAPQTLYNVVHHRPDTSGIPAALRPVVDACLAKDPRHRPTPHQLIDAVATMPARSGWPASVRRQITGDRAEADRWAAAGGDPAAEPARRGRSWAAAAAVLVLAAAGTVTGVLLSRDDPPKPADPLANRALELSDAQARLIATCALLGPDVIGDLGQPVAAEPIESAVCETRFVESDGRQTRLRVRVGIPVAADKPLSEQVAGRTVLDTTAQAGSCGRALPMRAGAALGVEVTISAPEGDSCGTAAAALRSVATRLVLDPPQAKLPNPSVVRLDPCAAVAQALLDTRLGPGVRPTPGDVHTCAWTGASTELTVRLTEAERVDTDPKYTTLFVDGGKLGDFDSARRIDPDGTCVTVHLVRSTVAGRGELIAVSARPSAGARADTACATTEAVLTGVVDAVRKS